MAAHTFICLFAILVVAAGVTSPVLGRVDEVEPQCRPGVFNPVNTITVNTCCNETNDDFKRELQYIKELLLTIKSGLENGNYCCDSEPLPPPRDCYEILQRGSTTSGVYTIYPDGTDPFDVYCDMDTDGGGWTVFQRREDGTVEFFLEWVAYASGFGSLTGEHWLGNDKLYFLSNQKTYRLRVDLGDFEDATRHAQYESFVIADASDNYRLSLGAYVSGDSNAGDSMGVCDDQQFSTRDQDHDTYSGNCAAAYKGGWWYAACHSANLNGAYLSGSHTSYANGVNWNLWRGYHYSLQFSEMKLRPV